MHDPLTFETRLADAYERYLAVAPVEVDAVTLAASVVGATQRRRWLPTLPAGPRRRVVIVGVAALLLLATVATVLLVVGQLVDRPRVPWVYRNEVISASDLPTPRAFSRLVTLEDGRVLILGGDGSERPTVAVFDPATGSTTSAGPLSASSFLYVSTAARLRDGRVMVIGDLRPPGGPVVPVVRLFDPATMQFRDAGPMAVPRVEAALAPLGDGRVLVAGGVGPGLGSGTPDDLIRTVEAFDPVTNMFGVVTQLPLAPAFESRLAALPDGRAAITLPFASPVGPVTTRLYAFDFSPDMFSEVATSASGQSPGPGLPLNATFVPLQNGRVLLVGEVTDPEGAVVPGVGIIWDVAAGTFERTRASTWSYLSAIGLDDGRLLLLGIYGQESGRPQGPWAATYDLETGTTTLLEDLVACYPDATRLLDGRVAFIGGLEDCAIRPENGGQLAPAVPTVQIFQ